MNWTRKLIVLALSFAVMATAWKMGWTAEPNPGVFIASLLILLIAGDLIMSTEKRKAFKRSYQNIDRKYNPSSRDFRNPWTPVVLAGGCVVGSLTLGMPKVLTITFLCLLGLFVLNALLKR